MKGLPIFDSYFSIMIEQPYAGRATITDNISQVDIVIPARKNWFLIPFACIWLCAWLFGVFSATGMLFHAHHGPPVLFMIVWLSMWTFFGLGAIYVVTWSMLGKEYISVGNGLLTIRRKNAIFFRPKTYELIHISNMTAKEQSIYQVRYRSGIGGYLRNMGTIGFAYGFKTVRFGDGLDEAEARHIIELLRSRKFIS